MMSPRLLSFGVVAALIAVTVPVAFALTPPAWIDEEYRTCTFDAVERETDARIEAERRYGEERVRDLEEYREELRRAWQIADEGDRRDELRQVDRRFRDATRETDRTYSDLIRDIRSTSRDAQRECRTRFNDHKRFTRNMCLSTADCRSNQVCSTERGVCDPSCPPDAEFCQQVCAGTCERATSSRSGTSRSSSSRSSSRSSTTGGHPWDDYQSNGQACTSNAACPNGYFCSTNLGECNMQCAPGFEQCVQVCTGTCLLYPINPASSSSSRSGTSSSRSSVPGGGGTNCQPWTCPDGREVPSCDQNGNPINYVQNPCYS